MPRNLSIRQLKFAAGIAAGKTQASAYEAAGYSPNNLPRTASRAARKLAQKGEIRAAIEKMQLELLPQPKDLRAINEHAMGVIVRLSIEAKEAKIRLAAAEWLHAETAKQLAERERLEKIEQQRAPRRESDEEIIAELRMLYAKALPDRRQPMLETVAEKVPGEE